MAQTPQAFRFSLILQAYNEAYRSGREGTDDASLLEAIGIKVHVINGLRDNIKLTTAEDLIVAQALFELRKKSI